MTSADTAFENQRREDIAAVRGQEDVRSLASNFLIATSRFRYSYHFDWLGLPIIQYPQDVVAVQEILWATRPQLVIETGVARGGSLALSASILALLGEGVVLGVDVDIREDNRTAIESHPLSSRIELIEGSSTDPGIIARVHARAEGCSRITVLLDSLHTRDHVLAELNAYAPLVTPGSYVIVFDTVIDAMPPDFFPDRPWGPDDNPAVAVREFLALNPDFEADRDLDAKLLLSTAPGGYLKRRSI